MRSWKNFGLTSTLGATASPSTSLWLMKKRRYIEIIVESKKVHHQVYLQEPILIWFSPIEGEPVGNDMYH